MPKVRIDTYIDNFSNDRKIHGSFFGATLVLKGSMDLPIIKKISKKDISM
jgi:hypothetical protein